MKEIKSFLKLKIIADLSELEPGEIALFNENLYYISCDESLNKIKINSTDNSIITKIYGIRIKHPENPSYEEPTIERVLINREISTTDGNITDTELIGDDTGLTFEARDNTFFNGEFENLEPFASMTQQEIPIREGNVAGYTSITGKFTTLPVFFKNKEKTRTVNSIKYDYYLISPLQFDDFYPVESHVKDNGEIIDKIYIESDWRQFETTERVINTDDFINFQLINDVIFYSYIYYIYLIKTASLYPFENIMQQKKSIFIYGVNGFERFDNYDSSMYDNLKSLTIDNTNNLSSVDSTKYPYYIKLTNGQTTDEFFRNIFFTDCNYNINAIYKESDDTSSRYISLIATPRFNLTQESGCVWLLVSEILTNQMSIEDAERFDYYMQKNLTITLSGEEDNDKLPYVIKLIPHFYNKTSNYTYGYSTFNKYREDITIPNNTYTNSGNFCIDNIRNILPVFYNSYIAKNESQSAYIQETLRTNITENYNNIINSGSSFGILDKINYKKSICEVTRDSAGKPYTRTNCYNNYRILNFLTQHNSTSQIIYTPIQTLYLPKNKNNKNINTIMSYDESYSYRDMTENEIFRNLSETNLNNYYRKLFNSGSGDFYFYRCTKLNDEKTSIDFDWFSITITKTTVDYNDYDESNRYFVSRLVAY